MDQREWDYGARMSRDRRAAEAWPTREPEVAEPEPRWASLADTGSLAPSEEALTWQRRADAWAQQAEVEPYNGGSQAIEPANRWSEVASTGRPTFPADGVGWRTQTAEWRATGARWRQTTEWRSSTGSHVWRSTTEAWRSQDEFTPEREKPAITGTAWPTPETDPATNDVSSATPSWQQPSSQTPSWQQSSSQTPSWQQPSAQTPSWQQSSAPTPSWQQPSAQTPPAQIPSAQTPAWQQPASPAPSWQRREAEDVPSWRRSEDPGRATRPVEQTWSETTTPSWQQPSAPAPSWQRSTEPWNRGADQQPPGENTTGLARWERTDAPGWQTSPVEDARHLVREDDRAAWQRESSYAERPPRRGRRRAPETDATPSGGTGWSTEADSGDNWARHTDTGNIQLYADPPQPTWGARAEGYEQPGGRRSRRDETSRRGTTRIPYGEPTSAVPSAYPGSPAETPPPSPDAGSPDRSRPRRGRPARYNANASDWREDTASWEAEPDTSNWTRDPDTGQWSRAEDDPRVLAWRAEAARREAMKEDGEESAPPRRGRRPDPPSGGVPGGPLPASGVPGGSAAEAAWPASGSPSDARIGVPSTRPRSSMPGSTPWSGAAAPSVPGAFDQERGRRHRDESYGAAEPPTGGGGRRRAPDQPAPEPWQPTADLRPSRQSRRQNAEPEEYPTESWRQGPLPPRQGFGTPRELPPGGREGYPPRELPPGGPSWGAQEPRQPSGGPSWAEPSRETSWGDQERRQPYPPRQQLPSGDPSTSWGEQGGRPPYRDQGPPRGVPAGEPSWAEQEPRRPNGAARALPAGGSQWPDTGRQPYPPRELPAGAPSWAQPEPEPRRTGFGSLRELPAGGSARPEPPREPAGPSWQEPRRPQAWSEQQPYGGQGATQWPDPLSQPRRASAPAYGATESPNGYDDRDDPPAGAGYGQARGATDWLSTERAARRGAQYRDGAGQDGETDWRQELSRDSALAEGESRRYDTSDFPPFRPSGSATVAGPSNLALSATSVISRVPEAPADAPEEEDTSWPPRRTTGAFQGTGSYERRPVGSGLVAGRGTDLLDPDDDEEDEQSTGGPLAAVGYTVVWYGVPVILFVAGMFLLNSGQRTHALDTLADAAPEFGVSLALSMLVALCLRWATSAWKSASVGLAAAVVGGGLATVLSSAITGNSLS
ncbi:hypothetical protein AB0F81_31275 [Actinoplanes sp. NPDC024001]|uniref:hypothetical protein n=1 Tax=Actinoplanes sp. NPDC024001 TaxID=3154598 RepID=UPI0033ED52BC